MRPGLAGFLIGSVLLGCAPVWADCRSDGQEATSMLMQLKQSALSSQAIDKGRFQAQFEPLVYRMKQNGCMSELMGLMNMIQREQQQYAER